MECENMTRFNEQDKKEAISKLMPMLRKSKFMVYSQVRHVSSSGMMRHIDFFVMNSNKPININWYIERITNTYFRAKSYNAKNADSLRVSGCGMDMGFAVVYALSSCIYGHRKESIFKCRGEGCPSNDHTNDRKPYQWDRVKSKGKIHSDGGYALIQKWL